VKRLAVIGYPIKHSISPAIHQAALDFCGVEATYVSLEVQPGDLGALVEELRGGDWGGINVTIPHKQAILPLMDELGPEAAAVGAVNTVVVSDGRLIGHNTDIKGFLRALSNDGGFEPEGRVVGLLGAGGAARAILWGLVQQKTRRVRLINRSRERAESLAEAARRWGKWTDVVVETWGQSGAEWEDVLLDCALIVNATSVGLSPHDSPVPASSMPMGAMVADLIYNPRPTLLLRDAGERGLSTLDGLPMLVYQGAASFELWTGMKAPVGVMRRAAEAALGIAPSGAPFQATLPTHSTAEKDAPKRRVSTRVVRRRRPGREDA
jgi:shikimate dehydrogenase